MLIICPDCETSYEVDSADLGAAGRKVRCTECGAVWRAAPEGTTSNDAERADSEPDAADDEFDPFAPLDAEALEIEMAEAEEDDLAEEIAPSPRFRRGRGTAPRRPMPQQRVRLLSLAAGVAVLLALGVWRHAVVSVMPDLAGLYAALGMKVNLRGLEFRDMNTVETTENGIPLLVVRGTIENVTGSDVDVPRLRLAVRAGSGREIFVWTAMPTKHGLKAGESLPFFAQLASPPADGRAVAVRFVGTRDGLQTLASQ